MKLLLMLFFLFGCGELFAQQHNLVTLLTANRLKGYSGNPAVITPGSDKPAVSARGLVLLEGLTLKTGRVEIDLRGKDILQQSFLGIAFNVVDSLHFEVVYFRPFNFMAIDTLRKKHAVQYMSMPDYPWPKLRNEHPGQYEQPLRIDQVAKEWFHATLLIDDDSVAVFVNHAKFPALKVKRLKKIDSDQVALWNDGLAGDFANLEVDADK